jgi:type IV secretory pathway TrbL component
MPERALAAILRSTGLSGQGPNAVSFTGGADPLLATPFRIAAAGAAALAATGLAAADLWQQRTGRPQTVTVDLRHATASLRGGLSDPLGHSAVETYGMQFSGR